MDQTFNDFIQKETEEKILKHGEIIFPLTYLTVEEQNEVTDIIVELETYMLESEAQFIKGSKPINDETWQEYLKTMENIGYKRLEEIYQAAYNRWKEV